MRIVSEDSFFEYYSHSNISYKNIEITQLTLLTPYYNLQLSRVYRFSFSATYLSTLEYSYIYVAMLVTF